MVRRPDPGCVPLEVESVSLHRDPAAARARREERRQRRRTKRRERRERRAGKHRDPGA
ncbi:hypothetical protein [Marmoricola sp. RAF53]|uniref:hypothetical protein n=1 Tax=Marmoricola sp. RAF53 TaxID=3233059 RepID=UPI003F9B852B